ncbi:alkane 1-monooxygenase, partial [Rhodococcus qingshengii]
MTPAASTPASIEGPSVWRDRKRYLWPLGLLIPLSPFISWFLVDNLRLGLFWATGAWLLVIVI